MVRETIEGVVDWVLDPWRAASSANNETVYGLGYLNWLKVAVFAVFPAMASGLVFGVDEAVRVVNGTLDGTPAAVQSLQTSPDTGIVVGVAAGVLALLFLHSVAEVGFVRVLRGGGAGTGPLLSVGARLFLLRVGVLAGVVGVLAVTAPAGVLSDPIRALDLTGGLAAVLLGAGWVIDTLSVEGVVPAMLADREPERPVEVTDRRRGDGALADTGRRAGRGATSQVAGQAGGPYPRPRARGLVELWRTLGRSLVDNPRTAAVYLVLRSVGEYAVAILTILGVVSVAVPLALVGGLLVAGVTTMVGTVPELGVDLAQFVLLPVAVVVVTGLVHTPIRGFVRYYGMFALGSTNPSVDAIPERRRSIHAASEQSGPHEE